MFVQGQLVDNYVAQISGLILDRQSNQQSVHWNLMDSEQTQSISLA